MELILAVLALLPAIALMVYIFLCDRVEHEPFKLLAALFLGGCVSVVPVVICELAAQPLLLTIFGNTVTYVFLENFFGVALMEEGWKLIFLILIAWKSRHFDYLFDGIVYAVFVSLGFAAVENIMYVTGEGSFGEGVQLAGARALLSVPLHAFCGVFMGFFFGQAKDAKVNGNKAALRRAKFMTIAVPVAVHGFYDFCLSMESTFLLLVFFVFVVIIYVYAFLRVRKSSKEDRAFSVKAASDPLVTITENAPESSPYSYASPVPAQPVDPNWFCPSCGASNQGNFCSSCGTPRPIRH